MGRFMQKDDENVKAIWELVTTELRGVFSATAYDLWIPVLELADIDESRATLVCKNEFKYGIISKRHMNTISKAFETVLGYPIKVEIVLEKEEDDEPEPEPEPDYGYGYNVDVDADVSTNDFVYHREYTFENFIVGGSNKFAQAACVAVANDPGEVYNPLFIYGPSGLGKTHLMYAVANEIRRRDKSKRIIYVTCEKFTNELIESISKKSTSAFREKYRRAHVLLIDDVQFIGGKESTQEEFFHTFNALFDNHNQIILTSDRPPKEINLLTDRMTNRFEQGLIADIQPPDMELRSAIIMKKSEAMGLKLPSDVVEYLSNKLKNNVRQIEGSLKRLGAMSMLLGEKITVDMAAKCLSDIVSEELPLPLKIARIIKEVSIKYGFDEADIRGSKRTKEIAWARHVAIYMLSKKTDMSQKAIASEFGRDRTTIISSINTIEREIASNPPFAAEINELMNEIDI